ncbi:MAG: hypothetical protein ABIQ93_17710 [Saprospiraceae bacterium]
MLKTLLFLPVVFLFFLIPPASNPNAEKVTVAGYGVICLYNDTDFEITYEYRWGIGEILTNTIHPGSMNRHWWAYSSSDHVSPAFHLSYDEDPSPYKNWRSVDLDRYRSQDISCEGAKEHAFYFSGRQISIHTLN